MGKFAFPLNSVEYFEYLKKRKTPEFWEKENGHVLIFSTPYWISGTKEYIAQTLYEASKCDGDYGWWLLR